MTLNSVNERAQNKFEELKKKLKLDVINTLDLDKRLVASKERLSEEEFQEFTNMPEILAIDKQKLDEVDTIFAFIDKLNLPSNLSLAIGLLISGHKTKNIEDYNKAIDAIQKEVLKYG